MPGSVGWDFGGPVKTQMVGRRQGVLELADEGHGFLTQEQVCGWVHPCMLLKGAGGSPTLLEGSNSGTTEPSYW